MPRAVASVRMQAAFAAPSIARSRTRSVTTPSRSAQPGSREPGFTHALTSAFAFIFAVFAAWQRCLSQGDVVVSELRFRDRLPSIDVLGESIPRNALYHNGVLVNVPR